MAFSWSKHYTDSSINPYVSFDNCMPSCTCYAYGRVKEMGLSAPIVGGTPGADSWPDHVNKSAGWEAVPYGTVTPKRGDVIVYSHTHVAVCEGGNSVSGSWYTGYRGYSSLGGKFDPRPANSYWAESPQGGALTVYVGSSVSDVMNWGSTYQSYRFYHDDGTVDYDGAGSPVYVLVSPGSPGPDPPGPEPGGWVYDHTEYITIGRTLCDDQQSPSVPDASRYVDVSDEIRNPRWDSISRITEERQIEYQPKSSGTWPEWGNIIGTDDFITWWPD